MVLELSGHKRNGQHSGAAVERQTLKTLNILVDNLLEKGFNHEFVALQ